MKEVIRIRALELFDRKGYHGASIRDISEAAGCKMPTVYHYYKSKANLFDEVVRVAYISLLNAIRGRMPEIMPPMEYCVESVIQKKRLSDEELMVHRLALKTWLGCEGCGAVRDKMIAWEAERNAMNEARLSDLFSSAAWSRILTRTFMNLVERIILFGDDIPDDQIREEIRIIFMAAMYKH
jgi:AcrR family transcriptional regulator